MPTSLPAPTKTPSDAQALAEIQAAIRDELGPELVDLIRKLEQRRTDRSTVGEDHPAPLGLSGVDKRVLCRETPVKVVVGHLEVHQVVETIAKGLRHVASLLDRSAAVK